MSVTAFSQKAKAVTDDVTKMMEVGWANSIEKKARGLQIQEMLTMASIVRYQLKAIEHGGMPAALKRQIKPPDMDARLMESTAPAADYIKVTLSECKDRIIAMHKENQSLRRAMKMISSRVKAEPEESVVNEVKAAAFWDDDAQMGQILGELDLEDETAAW